MDYYYFVTEYVNQKVYDLFRALLIRYFAGPSDYIIPFGASANTRCCCCHSLIQMYLTLELASSTTQAQHNKKTLPNFRPVFIVVWLSVMLFHVRSPSHTEKLWCDPTSTVRFMYDERDKTRYVRCLSSQETRD